VFDESGLCRLSDSIRIPGVLQPVVVRRVGDGFEIVAGERRWRLAELAVKRELSVRAIEEIIRKGRSIADGLEAIADPRGLKHAARFRSAHLRDMEQRFERALKTKVAIREGKRKGTGRIVIDFFTLDDFDRVAERLGVSAE